MSAQPAGRVRPATLRDLNRPRASVGATEARLLANAARRTTLPDADGVERSLAPGHARSLLELMLRLVHGDRPIERGTKWLADQLCCCHKTARTALDRLEAAGLLVVVRKGLGKERSRYLVNVDLARVLGGELPEVSPVDKSVHPGELDDFTRGNSYPTPGQFLPLPGAGITPPNAHARPSSRSNQKKGPHTTARTSPQPVDSPPAAGGRVPLRRSTPDEKCPHGRTIAQGGCRTCGTNARAAEKVARAEADAAARVERERQVERDAAERAERQKRLDETSPETIRAAREALRAARA